jgi:hypothetical protein
MIPSRPFFISKQWRARLALMRLVAGERLLRRGAR